MKDLISRIKKLNNNFFLYAFLYLCSLCAFGYPIFAFFPGFLHIDSALPNLITKIFLLSVFVYFIYLHWVNVFRSKAGLPFYMLFCFLLIYGVRLIYDIEVLKIQFEDKSPFLIYSYYFGLVVIPFISIYCNQQYFKRKPKRLLHIIYWVTLVSAIAITILVYLNPDLVLETLISETRLDIGSEVDQGGLINPITISFTGELLIAASILLMKANNIIFNLRYLPSVFLGIILLILGASRGPFLSLIVALIYLLIKIYAQSGNFIKGVFAFLKIIAIIVVIYIVLQLFIDIDDFTLIKRISFFSSDSLKDEDRYIIWRGALSQFFSSPILGDCYIERVSKFYPHNSLIEVLMATGIVGSSIYFFALASTFKRIFFNRKKETLFLELIFILLFLSEMTSGSLIFSTSFWMIWAIVLLCINNQVNESFKSPNLIVNKLL